MSAEQIVLNAVQKAQNILAHYVEPGPCNAEQTINELMTILDDNNVVAAVWELDPKSKPDKES